MPASASSSAPRPFLFDTVFDRGRVIAPAPPAKAAWSAEEVEAARIAGYAEGQASAVALAEAEAARALAAVRADIADALDALRALAHEHRAASAALALACGRALAGAALERFPEAPVQAALEALAREVEAQPRLLVRCAADRAERLGEALAHTAEAVGHAGAVQVKADAGLAGAAFTFDWGDGRAVFDPAAAALRLEQALAAALAAEGLHAEPPLPPSLESRP